MNERLARVMKALNKSNAQMARLMGYSRASGFNGLLHSDKKIPEAKLNMLVNAEIDGKKVSRSYLLGESDSIFVNDIQIMEADQPGLVETKLSNQTDKAMDSQTYERLLREKQTEIEWLRAKIDNYEQIMRECLGEVIKPNHRRE